MDCSLLSIVDTQFILELRVYISFILLFAIALILHSPCILITISWGIKQFQLIGEHVFSENYSWCFVRYLYSIYFFLFFFIAFVALVRITHFGSIESQWQGLENVRLEIRECSIFNWISKNQNCELWKVLNVNNRISFSEQLHVIRSLCCCDSLCAWIGSFRTSYTMYNSNMNNAKDIMAKIEKSNQFNKQQPSMRWNIDRLAAMKHKLKRLNVINRMLTTFDAFICSTTVGFSLSLPLSNIRNDSMFMKLCTSIEIVFWFNSLLKCRVDQMAIGTGLWKST